MNRTWKKAAALILAAAMALGLAACGDGNSQTDPAAQTGNPHAPLTINRISNLITEEFVEALHEVYPEINLQIVSYAGNNGSGYARYSMEMDDMTDIHITTQPFHKELMAERFVDLSNYDFLDNYSTFLLNSLDVDGSIYLLPSGYTVAGMFYNRTILQENGWAVPTSFEELMALAPEIEAAGYQPFANAMDLEGYPFNYFFSLGNTVYFGTQDGVQWKERFPSGEASAAGNQGLEDVVRYYDEWIKNGVITGEHMSNREFMESGRVVFYLCLGLSSYAYEAQDGNTYEFGILPWLSRDGSNNMLTRNVSRYFALNKHLEEPGNEQKLQDALHVMEFLSSEAGQKAVMIDIGAYISPLSDGKMAEDSPYQEVADTIYSGHSVQLVYVGWEDLLVPIAQDLRALIEGEIPAEELTRQFDTTYGEVADSSVNTIYGTLTETLTYEKTAELCAIAEGKAADADCAMVSLNEYHGEDNFNRNGVAWHLWSGKVGNENINMIVSAGNVSVAVLELTGGEIEQMQQSGFDANQNGDPYPYVLVTKGGMELDDDTVYRLAIAENELPEAMCERAAVLDVSAKNAILDYVRALGTFGAADIVWEG